MSVGLLANSQSCTSATRSGGRPVSSRSVGNGLLRSWGRRRREPIRDFKLEIAGPLRVETQQLGDRNGGLVADGLSELGELDARELVETLTNRMWRVRIEPEYG